MAKKRKSKKQREQQRQEIKRAFARSWRSKDGETPCGAGSTLASTERVRAELPEIFDKYSIRSINDAGCGDFHWVEKLKLLFKSKKIDYLGYDIIDRKRRVLPFQELEITSETMRRADLIICRDVLFHLSNELVEAAIKQFRKSKSRYLLATTSPGDNSLREDTVEKFQPVDLESDPFNLGEPLLKVHEPQFRRYLGLWEL